MMVETSMLVALTMKFSKCLGADEKVQPSMSMKTKLSVYVNMNHSNIVDRSSMKLREICSKFCSMAA